MKIVGMLTTHQHSPDLSVVVLATLGHAMIPLDISGVMPQYARANTSKPVGIIGEIKDGAIKVEQIIQDEPTPGPRAA